MPSKFLDNDKGLQHDSLPGAYELIQAVDVDAVHARELEVRRASFELSALSDEVPVAQVPVPSPPALAHVLESGRSPIA